MTFEAFLKLDGIDGGSRAKGHRGEIEVLSFAWGETNVAATAGGADAGRASRLELNFAMLMDMASPKLMSACASGEHIKEAVLTCRKATGDKAEFLRITLTDVVVSTYQTAGDTGSNLARPYDHVSLAFGEIEMVYTAPSGEAVKS